MVEWAPSWLARNMDSLYLYIGVIAVAILATAFVSFSDPSYFPFLFHTLYDFSLIYRLGPSACFRSSVDCAEQPQNWDYRPCQKSKWSFFIAQSPHYTTSLNSFLIAGFGTKSKPIALKEGWARARARVRVWPHIFHRQSLCPFSSFSYQKTRNQWK